MHIPAIPSNPDAADLAILEVRLASSPDSQGKRWLLFLIGEYRRLSAESDLQERTFQHLRDLADDGRKALSNMRHHLQDVADVPDEVWKYEDEADDLFVDINEYEPE